ncbi:MAG TPA: hypothetical protein DDY20_05325 [Desulfobulbaceae bacterium]|nr:hypothetical protein [Desulfobulbaceae bacterium]
MRRLILAGLALLLMLGGCYTKPVRHLASDASLIRAGESTRQDVLRYLGEPNGRRTVSSGVEEFVYYEERRSLMQRTPLIGPFIGSEGNEMLMLTLTGDLVTDSVFRTFREDERDWANDFTWDELK